MADSAAAITPRPILMRDSIAARVVRRHKRKPAQVPESQPPPKKARKSVIQFRLSPDKVVIPEHPSSKDATDPMPKAPKLKREKPVKKMSYKEFKAHPKVLALVKKIASWHDSEFTSDRHRKIYEIRIQGHLRKKYLSEELRID